MASQDKDEVTQPGTQTTEGWNERWKGGTTGWHKSEVDKYLKKHLNRLTEGKPSSILVSWCGKSLDLLWLCEQGHTVVGVELSEVGVIQLFKENGVPHSVTEKDGFKVYTATDRNLKVYSGSMFDFTPQIAGCMFDAIWDQHALGAVNPSERGKHIAVLQNILKPHGHILLSHYEYDPSEHDGPPFSLSPSQILALFKDNFEVELVEHVDMTGTVVANKFNLTWAKRPIHLLSYTSLK